MYTPNAPINPALREWFIQYQQWWTYVQNQRMAALRASQSQMELARMTPLRFQHRHSRVCFGATNQLLVVYGTTVTIQQLDPSLIDLGESALVSTWPGPLIKGETDKNDVTEYIRTQESFLKQLEQMPEQYNRSHQKKQVWLLLSMLLKQGGLITGADLSEMLLSNNEQEFESADESSEMGKLRRYLMLGQRKTALEHSTKSGLWGHAFALTYFNDQSKQAGSSSATGGTNGPQQMSNMISKFINSTLSREDPIFVLFRTLLQKHLQQQQVPTSNLQQFAMLLANDCDVSPVISESTQSKELLKFIVALRSTAGSSQTLVNLANLDTLDGFGDAINADDKRASRFTYSDELVFVNEIWEFARNLNEFIERLVPLKLIFAARLFDYGLLNQASRYCYVLRQYFTYYHYYFKDRTIKDSPLDWDTIMQTVNDIECRIYQFDVSKGASKEEAEATVAQERKEAELKSRKGTSADEEDEKPANDLADGNGEIESGSPTGDEVDDEELDEEETGEDEEETESSMTQEEPQRTVPTKQMRALTIQQQQTRPASSKQSSSTQQHKLQSQTNQATAKPKSTAAPSSVATNGSQRTRSISNEKTRTATPPHSPKDGPVVKPVETLSSQRQAFPIGNNEATTAQPPSQNKPQLFVPAAVTVADLPPLDFVSSPAAMSPPSPTGADNMLSSDNEPSHHAPHLHQPPLPAMNNSNHNQSYGEDGRLSVPPPRDDKHFQANSTMAGGGFQPAVSNFGQSAMAFSPITSPEPAAQINNSRSPSFHHHQTSQYESSAADPLAYGGSHQQHQHSNTSGGGGGQQHSGVAGGANDSSSKDNSGKSNNQEKSKGWWGSLVEKVVPTGPKQAILPDDRNPTIHWDENLKRWVNKDDPDQSQQIDAILQGPPKIPVANVNSSPSGAPAPVRQQQPLQTSLPSPPVPASMPTLPGAGPSQQTAAPMANGGNNSFSYGVGRGAMRKRYVDVWQQQHQPN